MALLQLVAVALLFGVVLYLVIRVALSELRLSYLIERVNLLEHDVSLRWGTRPCAHEPPESFTPPDVWDSVRRLG